MGFKKRLCRELDDMDAAISNTRLKAYVCRDNSLYQYTEGWKAEMDEIWNLLEEEEKGNGRKRNR